MPSYSTTSRSYASSRLDRGRSKYRQGSLGGREMDSGQDDMIETWDQPNCKSSQQRTDGQTMRYDTRQWPTDTPSIYGGSSSQFSSSRSYDRHDDRRKERTYSDSPAAYPPQQWNDGRGLAQQSYVSRYSTSPIEADRASSISPSESASNISYSSRSSRSSTSFRDDPQRLYDYVADHLRYGEHEGAVWNKATDSYVTIIRPQ